MKIKFLFLFLLLAWSVCACQSSPGKDVLSSETSLTINSINSEAIVDSTIELTADEWIQLMNVDIKNLTEFELAEKATLEVILDRGKKEIIYIVTAEDGTIAKTTIKVKIIELSSDKSFNLESIDGKIIIDNQVTLTSIEWHVWQSLDLKSRCVYSIAEKATLDVGIIKDTKEINFLVTAEDGSTEGHIIRVRIASSDASISFNSIAGKNVSQGKIIMNASEWALFKDSNIITETSCNVAETATLTATLDVELKEITYVVTAEDGKKNTVKILVEIKETIANTNLILAKNAGGETATTHWFATYGEEGITIKVDVLDNIVYYGNSQTGMNDNIEFIIGLRSRKHTLSIDTDYKVLVEADNDYYFQKAISTSDFGNSDAVDHQAIGLVFGETFWCSTEEVEFVTGPGYRVEVYIAYSVLGTNKDEALGNLTICPAMRNSSATATEWTHFEGLGCKWCKSYSYVGIEEDGTFVNNVTKYYSDIDYLFIGDSWIDTWFWINFDNDFANYEALCTGIGGTCAEHWYNRRFEVQAFNPKNLVFRIGTNDINETGQSPESVAKEILDLFNTYHTLMPNTHIYFLSIDPCISHYYNWSNGKMNIANQAIKTGIENLDYVTFVDFASKLLDANGNVIPQNFRGDGCHLSIAGYALYVKTMYQALGLPWNEGVVFGDSGIMTHTLGFSSGNDNSTSNTLIHEQHTYFKDFASTELYAEFEITANKVFNNYNWPKFGIRLANENKSLCLYIDAFKNLNGQNVGAVLSNGKDSYDWGNKPALDQYVQNMNYTNGNYTKLGVLRTNGYIYFFVNELCVMSFADVFGTNEVAVGAFVFNTKVSIKNGYVSNDEIVINSKIPNLN